ncbi:class I SAM-dependent methyltransferase [bacterium]|nr:class I SAM-dependent methyltransferase [bacterium]
MGSWTLPAHAYEADRFGCRDDLFRNSGFLLVTFHNIYDGLFAGKPYDEEISKALKLLGGRPKRILEAGCGTGRHTEILLQRGLQVTAVDPDPAMLRRAKERNRSYLGRSFRPLLGSVEAFPRGRVDGAISLFHVVNYIQTEQQLLRFFSGLSRRLKKNKHLVFDAWNGLAAISDPPRRNSPVRRVRVDGHCYECRMRTDTDLWRMMSKITVRISSRGRLLGTYRYNHRIWLPEEIRGLLEVSGFRCDRISTWAHPARPATARDWKIVFVARKM